ncbi:hypothetical protein LSTR_LSTR005200 [Laodelphax striatellus]|uniref:F-box domain-containing protein n=1 Tax=Laodelphax striatellus TaxID=195883 RepID=A0A482XMS5_LAOST|nr:hypothetical protein LSTR_LSTR005200 [Laodelphax striatellus]
MATMASSNKENECREGEKTDSGGGEGGGCEEGGSGVDEVAESEGDEEEEEEEEKENEVEENEDKEEELEPVTTTEQQIVETTNGDPDDQEVEEGEINEDAEEEKNVKKEEEEVADVDGMEDCQMKAEEDTDHMKETGDGGIEEDSVKEEVKEEEEDVKEEIKKEEEDVKEEVKERREVKSDLKYCCTLGRKRKSEKDNPNGLPCKKSLLFSEDKTVLLSSLKKKSGESGNCVEKVRLPRSVIPSKDNPPEDITEWLSQFQRWLNAERMLAIGGLVELCEPTQVRYMMSLIEPQFQRDFISLLPKELALYVLSYLEPRDLLRAAQTCRSWRFLAEDNLLWREKCREAGVDRGCDATATGAASKRVPKRHSISAVSAPAAGAGRGGSPWKAAFMRHHTIEMNWRQRPVRPPKLESTAHEVSLNILAPGLDGTPPTLGGLTGLARVNLVPPLGAIGGTWCRAVTRLSTDEERPVVVVVAALMFNSSFESIRSRQLPSVVGKPGH